tara:strand:+ start:14707 stop:15435 length:729 start_codon:yes stop_codon:yes gene_type:complete
MTFGEAFAKARKEQGAGGTFTYKGKKYSTNRADDKAKVTKNNVEKKTDVKPKKKPKIEEKKKKKKRDLVPDNIELFVKDLIGIEDDYTEEDFGDTTLDSLRTAAQNAIDADRDYIGYGDYDDIQGSSYTDSIFKTISDPNKIAKTTIGAANLGVEDGNLYLTDMYDFNDAADVSGMGVIDKLRGVYDETTNPYTGLRALGKYFGSGEGGGSSVKLNLGPASDFYDEDRLAGIMSTDAAKDII